MELEKERWKKIKDYEDYLISSYGRVYALSKIIFSKRYNKNINRKPKFLKVYTNTRGYNSITLKDKPILVHRLVAIAFIDNPDNKPEVNHINGIRNYNYYKNLEWCTRKENAIHAHKTGLQIAVKGEKHYLTNLTVEQVIDIKITKGKRGIGKILAEKYNVTNRTISNIRTGRNWKHIIIEDTYEHISIFKEGKPQNNKI